MVELRYFAGAADYVGTDREFVELSASATVADLKALLIARHGDRMSQLLKVAAFLIGDDLVRAEDHHLADRVDVLPPFAGG